MACVKAAEATGGTQVGHGIGAISQSEVRKARHLCPLRSVEGPNKDQTERTRLDSPGQMGALFSEGERGACLWSRVEADPLLAASIPAASTKVQRE